MLHALMCGKCKQNSVETSEGRDKLNHLGIDGSIQVLNLNSSVLGWNCTAQDRTERKVLLHTAKNLRFYKRQIISSVAALLNSSEVFGWAELISYTYNCRKTKKIFNTIRENKSKLESKSRSF